MTSSIYTGVHGSKYGINRPHVRYNKWCVIMTMVTTDSDGELEQVHSAVLSRRDIRKHGFKDAFALELEYALTQGNMYTFESNKPIYDAMYAA